MTEPQDQQREFDQPVVPPTGAPQHAETVGESQPEAAEPTIGTGTSIALGCVAGTVLLIVIGLVFLLIVMVLN
jgi:hypothetical protein